MTAKEYLEQLGMIERRIRVNRRKVDEWFDIATSVTANVDAVGGGSGESDKIGKLVAQIADANDQTVADTIELCRKKREIESVIDSVNDPRLQDLLTMRYVCFATWQEIADDFGITTQWVHILHGRALSDVQKIIDALDCN